MNGLIRRDPLDDLFRGFFVRPVELGSPADAPAVKIDVKEQEGGYLVHAEIPGVKKEDIHVAVDGPVVSISAERRREPRADGRTVRPSWRCRGRATPRRRC